MPSPRATAPVPERLLLSRRRPVLPLLLLALLAAPLAAQTVDPPSPAVGTSGTILTVAIDGLGDKPPKVWLTRDDTKKRTKLKLLQASPTQLVLLLKKAPAAGVYDLTIKPKGGAEIELDEAFSVAAPQGLELVPAFGMPLQSLAIQGFHLGDRKGSVRIGGKKAKVLDWQAELGTDPDGIELPTGQVLVRIPKGLPNGMHPVELSNDAGSALTAVALTLGGSDTTPKGKKPRLTAQVGDLLLETKQVSHVVGPDEVEVHAVFPTSDLNPGDLVLRLVLDTTADLPGELTQADWQAFVRYDPPQSGDGCGTCPFYVSTSCTVSDLELDGTLLRASFQAELEDLLDIGPPLTLQAGQVTSKLSDEVPAPVATPSIVSFSVSDEAPAVGQLVSFSWELADVDPDLTSWTLEVPLGSEPLTNPVSGVASYTPLNAVSAGARLRLFQAGQQVAVETVSLFPEGLLVIIDEPWVDQVVDEVLPVRARVGGAVLELTEVLASVGDVQVPLVAQDGDFVGDVPLASLTPGLQQLVVSAEDLGGNLSQATRGFDYDIQPVLTITEPAIWSVATPELPIQLSGSDADGGPLSLTVTVKPNSGASVVVASGDDVLDTLVDLSAWDGQDVELVITIQDGSWSLQTKVPIFIEASPALDPLLVLPGELVDLSDDGMQAVLVDRESDPPSYVLFDLGLLTSEPVPVPEGLEILPDLAFWPEPSAWLTPTGVLFEAREEGASSLGRHLVDWHDGELIVLSEGLSDVSVAGDYASFTEFFDADETIFRWRFSTATLVSQVGGVVNDDQQVTDLGDIFWIDEVEPRQAFRKPKGEPVEQLSGETLDTHVGMLAEGERALYARKTDQLNNSAQIALHDGETEIQVREYQPFSVVGLDYRLAGEWVAFNREGTSGQRQAWVRDPLGVETKVSPFADDSFLEVLADDGTLVFRTDDRRYLWRGSGTPDDVGAFQGRVARRGGLWFLLLGNTLFHVP